MPPFSHISFESQFSELDKTKAWLKKIGIEVSNTIFEKIYELNKTIVEHIQENNDRSIKSIIEKHTNLRLWIALTEANSFVRIYNSFKSDKSHKLPRAKLKKMLSGPFFSWDENPGSGEDEARNILFELSCAASFRAAGFKLLGFEDIDFVFQKHKFNVQCKRLQSEGNIIHNIEAAAKQFTKRMKRNSKGIICLSIDKISGIEEKVLSAARPVEISPSMNKVNNAFIREYRSIWGAFINNNILAVIIVLKAIADVGIEPNNIITTCKETAVDIIPMPGFIQGADYNLIMALSNKIGVKR